MPATTANAVPSRSTSIAAAVAARADMIFDCGTSIDPEQSTMMISAAPLAPPAPPDGPPLGNAISAAELTVTTALTVRPPSGRYWFWSTSTVKPDSLM